MQVLLLHLEAPLLHQGAAHQLPLEVLGETREILLDILLGELAVVGLDEPALQELLGELHVGLLHEEVADILGQAPLRLALVLVLQALGDFLLDVLVGLGLLALLLVLGIILLHAVDHRSLVLRSDGHGIRRHGVGLLHLHVHLRGQAQVEDEGEVLAGLPRQFGLVRRSEGLAQDVELLVVDVLVEGLADHLVHGLDERLLAIDALDQGSGHHALAEALELRRTATVGKFFLFNLSIVCRGHLDGQLAVQIVNLLFFYFHNAILCSFLIFSWDTRPARGGSARYTA